MNTPTPLRLAAGLLVLALVAPQIACGTPCEHIRQDRERFLAREGGTDAPHLVVALPFALANRIVAERFGQPAPLPLRLPGLGPVSRFFDRVLLVPRSLTLQPARADRLGVRLVVDVRVGRATATTLTFDVEAQPVVDARQGRLDLVLRADDLRDVRPRLGPAAVDAVADAVHGLLPGPAKRLVSRRDIARVADVVTDALVSQSWALLRDGALADIGVVARVSIALPDVPVAALRLRSVGDARRGHLELAVTSTLPVAEGLDITRPGPRPRGDAIAVRLSGDAAAALGNYAIALGVLPDRFDPEGHPVQDGPFEAGLGWSAGSRPLQVLLWKTDPPCISARLAGAVGVRVEGDEAVVDFRDGTIEEVRGPPEVEIGAWFAGLWADAITFTLRSAADLRLDVAGVPLKARIRRVHVAAETITVELGVETAR